MDLGIVTSSLASYGGAEIYLLECMRRWQRWARMTLYVVDLDPALLRKFDIDPARLRVETLPAPPRERASLLHDTLIYPRVWERRIARHDATFLYLFPTQHIHRERSIWFAAEPLRMIYDLRHHPRATQATASVHLYPRLEYDTVELGEHEAMLELIEAADAHTNFDALATNSQTTARYLAKVYGRRADCVAYPGANAPPTALRSDPVRGRDRALGGMRALSVGRLWRHKRVDLAIRGLARLDSGELDIVGDGPDREDLCRLAADLGVSDRVHMLGSIVPNTLHEKYLAADCCIYTSIREPFGMVPIEAAMHGLPVIGTRCGGYSEILDESCAHFVEPTAEAVAQALADVFDHPVRARAMGVAGRSRARRLTWDSCADRLWQLIDTTASTRPPRKASVPAPHSTKLGAHYYPWYRSGKHALHWNDTPAYGGVTDTPIAGRYDSTNASTLDSHLEQASRAGLDFLTINWQIGADGLHPHDLQATRGLFDAVERSDSRVELSILIVQDVENPQTMLESIELLRREFLTRRAYHRHRDRPVVWYFLSDPFMGFYYLHHEAFMALQGDTWRIATGAIPYAASLPRILREDWAGWTVYSPLQAAPQADQRDALLETAYMDARRDGLPLGVFTICPGFDDRHLDDPARNLAPSRAIEGPVDHVYRHMHERVLRLNPAPDMVMVTSFNEFHENTHIEASQRHGHSRLHATRELAQALKRRPRAL